LSTEESDGQSPELYVTYTTVWPEARSPPLYRYLLSHGLRNPHFLTRPSTARIVVKLSHAGKMSTSTILTPGLVKSFPEQSGIEYVISRTVHVASTAAAATKHLSACTFIQTVVVIAKYRYGRHAGSELTCKDSLLLRIITVCPESFARIS